MIITISVMFTLIIIWFLGYATHAILSQPEKVDKVSSGMSCEREPDNQCVHYFVNMMDSRGRDARRVIKMKKIKTNDQSERECCERDRCEWVNSPTGKCFWDKHRCPRNTERLNEAENKQIFTKVDFDKWRAERKKRDGSEIKKKTEVA